MPARKSCWSRIIGERAVRPIASSTSASIDASVPCDDLDEDRVDHRATTTLPRSSTRAVKPGWIGSVEPNSWITAGPVDLSPDSRSRAYTGASCRRSPK